MGRIWLGLVLVLASAGIARAGVWYYTWSCAGECAPGRLTIEGVEGPFGSSDECESVRSRDSRRDYFLAPGNLGGTNSCQQTDGAPPPVSSSSTTPSRVPIQRLRLALLGGPGYRVRDGMTESAGSATGGIEATLIGGARPVFGVELTLGLQSSSVTAPHFGAEPRRLTYVPMTIGLTSSPGKDRVRFELGADMGFLLQVGCDTCEADNLSTVSFTYSLRAGLDFYLTHKLGIGAAAVFYFGKQGDLADTIDPSMIEIAPPTFLIRIALTRRNPLLGW